MTKPDKKLLVHYRKTARKYQRQVSSLESKIEKLAADSPAASRMLTYIRLHKEASESRRLAAQSLGFLVASKEYDSLERGD